MTRAAAFLSAALLAASLGVAQDTSTSGTASRQNNNGSTTITTSNPNQGSTVNGVAADSPRVASSHNANVTPAEASELSDDMKESLAQNPQPNSTALQLLGLIGVGSLIAGFFMRR
jgi:ABC-type Zn uptake system ZnuABC Zn-binding protein ZnuA